MKLTRRERRHSKTLLVALILIPMLIGVGCIAYGVAVPILALGRFYMVVGTLWLTVSVIEIFTVVATVVIADRYYRED